MNNRNIIGWIIGLRRHKNVIFIDVDTYSGREQFIIKQDLIEKINNLVKNLAKESLVEITYIADNQYGNIVKDIKVINEAKGLYPFKYIRLSSPYNPRFINLRHVLFKNAVFRDILKIRAYLIRSIQSYLDNRGFIEISTPVISPVTYYGEDSAFKIDFNGYKVYLNQCNAYYLEAALLGFEKVYSLIPSFRAEKIRSPRYLNEYWHLKGEIAFYNLYDTMNFVEEFIFNILIILQKTFQDKLHKLNNNFNVDFYKPPYYRIDYDEAVKMIQRAKPDFQWGDQIGSDEEKILSQHFDKPFWIMHLPRKTQPFPYRLHPKIRDKTLTADLIVPRHGEILGVAEKIYRMDELLERINNDGLPDQNIENYRWYIELRDAGLPPHSGFGLGIERFLKAILDAPHVRDVIPFPRLYSRRPVP